MRKLVAAAIQIVGVIVIVLAGFAASVTLGWFIVGGAVLAFGVAVERG